MRLTDRRTVPEATRAPTRLSFKDAESASGQLLAIEDAEGIVTAIVSVTGTEDEVADIIVPGAYAETLVKRRPKVCWAHSWEHPIGRVLHIEELMPGDDRLPRTTKDGQPWDPKAGALVATMQFNMRTDEGKNAFEAVRFYSETGECEYSIGYNVPAGKSSRDAHGVRHIKMLDLYELSVVLFGAHTMTGTLSIKQALAAALERKTLGGRGTVNPKGMVGTVGVGGSAKAALAAAQQAKAAPPPPVAPAAPAPVAPAAEKPKAEPDAATVKPEKPESGLPDHTDGVMVALYPDPAAADAIAEAIAGPDDTTPREELHVTLAYLGKSSEGAMTSDELHKIVSEAIEGEHSLTGTVGGIGTFPPSEGSEGEEVTWVPVDVPGLTLLRETIVEALGDKMPDSEHGFTPHMTIGYGIGVIDPLPSIPVTFSEVRVVHGTATRAVPLSAPRDPDDDAPWQQKDTPMNIEALPISEVVRLTAIESLTQMGAEVKAEGGADRNRGGAEELRRYWTTGAGGAKIAWGTGGDFTRCTKFLSEHMTPENAKGYCANRHKEMTGMWPGDKDNKGYDPALETKGPDVPASKGYPRLPGSMEERRDALEAAVTEALQGDEVEDKNNGSGYEWDYVSIDATFEDRVIATRCQWGPTDRRETFEMGYRHTGDGVELDEPERVELHVIAVGVEGEEDGDTPVGDLLPFADDVLAVAQAFKAAHASSMETKAGRVLSGKNERALREAWENLSNVLRAAGVLTDEEGDSDKPTGLTPPGKRDDRKPVDPSVDVSTTSPSASTKAADDGVIERKGDVVVLDSKSIEARLAALRGDA